jgi:putative tryptophan/tyrosine transport system substrate-binding protein
MNTRSDGVVESWSVGSIRIRASLQYSSTTILRLRAFLTLCALLFALCSSTEAQQTRTVTRIGYLSSVNPANESARAEGIRLALQERGYIEGQNIAIEYRYGEGKIDHYPELANELVRLKSDIIVVAGGIHLIRAAKNATKTIPIVMVGWERPCRSRPN